MSRSESARPEASTSEAALSTSGATRKTAIVKPLSDAMRASWDPGSPSRKTGAYAATTGAVACRASSSTSPNGGEATISPRSRALPAVVQRISSEAMSNPSANALGGSM